MSIFGFDIGAQIIKGGQSGILEKGGGHKMAGGFTIKKEKISHFRDQLIENFEKVYSSSTKSIDLYIDTIIAPSSLNKNFYNEVNSLSPFGSGNNEPKFVIENINVISSSVNLK